MNTVHGKDHKAEMERCLSVLRDGGVILYPTDTIWGIGCDATNADAVARVAAIKNRPDDKSFVILLDSAERLGKYVKRVPDIAWDLVELSEKPLTIVYPGAVNVAPQAIAADGTIAIRVTRHPFCRELVARLGRPLVSTSANTAGEPSPESFEAIPDAIRTRVDYVVDLPGERKREGRPSAILSLGLNGEIRIIRK